MASSSNVSILPTLFIYMFIIFFLISKPNGVTSTRFNLYHIIKSACSPGIVHLDSKLCIQILRSQHRVVSAKNLFNLSIGIMESGISNATNTHRYMQKKLNKPGINPKLKGALKECEQSYHSVILSFNSALSEVRDDKEYETAIYDLIIGSTDYIKPCVDALRSRKIKDRTMLFGNRVVPIFGLSASEVLTQLDNSNN